MEVFYAVSSWPCLEAEETWIALYNVDSSVPWMFPCSGEAQKLEPQPWKHLTVALASREPTDLLWPCSKGAQAEHQGLCHPGCYGDPKGNPQGLAGIPKQPLWKSQRKGVGSSPGLPGIPNQQLLPVVPKSSFQRCTSIQGDTGPHNQAPGCHCCLGSPLWLHLK